MKVKVLVYATMIVLLYSLLFNFFIGNATIQPVTTELPELSEGMHYASIIEMYGSPYVSYGRITEWKTDDWIILGCFTMDGYESLEEYGLFDKDFRYIYGTIRGESLLHVLHEILTVDPEEMDRVYDTGGGYGGYGRITEEGLIVLWLNPWDITVFDAHSTAYAETSLLLYIMTHPLLIISTCF